MKEADEVEDQGSEVEIFTVRYEGLGEEINGTGEEMLPFEDFRKEE